MAFLDSPACGVTDKLSNADPSPRMLIYSALSPSPFRSIKLRSRKPDCRACGVGRKQQLIDQEDYLEMCGFYPPDWESLGLVKGEAGHRITSKVRLEYCCVGQCLAC